MRNASDLPGGISLGSGEIRIVAQVAPSWGDTVTEIAAPLELEVIGSQILVLRLLSKNVD